MSLFPTNTANYVTNPVVGTLNINSNALINVSSINGFRYNPGVTFSTFVTNPMCINLDGSNFSMSNINDITADTLLANGLTANGISYLYDANISTIKQLKLISTTTQLNINSGSNMSFTTNNTYNVVAKDATLQAVTAASLTAPTARIGNVLNLSGQYTSQIFLNGDVRFTTSTLTGISSINGVLYPPPETNTSQWATLPAIAPIQPFSGQNLVLSNASATDIRVIATGGGNIAIAAASGTVSLGSFLTPAVNIIGGTVGMLYGTCAMGLPAGGSQTTLYGNLAVSSITSVSTINGSIYPPTLPDLATWASYAAQVNINAGANQLSNCSRVNGVSGSYLYIGGPAVGVQIDSPSINLIGTNNLIQAATGGTTAIRGYTDVQGPASIPQLINVSSINGSPFPALPTVKYLGQTGQQLNPNDWVVWGVGGVTPTTLFGNVVPASNLITWIASFIGGTTYTYFSPVVTGVYTITLDVGQAFCASDDVGQTDTLYSIMFGLSQTGLVNPKLGDLVSCSRYEVISGQDKMITYPTVGSLTEYLVAGQTYGIQTYLPANAQSTGYVAGVNPTICFSRVF